MNLKDKVLLYQSLYTMVNAGLDFLRSLDVLSSQKHTKRARHAIDTLREGVEAGRTLSDSIRGHPDLFTTFDREMIGVGEQSGNLDSILKLLLEYYETLLGIRKSIISGMVYPLFLIHALVLITPILSLLFLPGYTIAQFLLVLGKLILLLDILPLPLWWVAQVPSVKAKTEVLLGKIPFLLTLDYAKFFLALKIMYGAGIDLQSSLSASSRLCKSANLRKECTAIAYAVKRGATLTDSFSRSSTFPLIVLNLIGTGEKSGTIEEMLDKITSHYMEKLQRTVAHLKSILPKAIYFLAVIVIAAQMIAQYRGTATEYTNAIDSVLD